MSQSQDPFKVLDAVVANGIGTPMLISDYRHLTLGLDAPTASATIKFQVSMQKEMPDFAAAQSPTNQWDYARSIDLEDASSLDGDTGVVLSSASVNKQYEVQINAARWFCPIVSGWSGGAITLLAFARNDS